RGQDDLFDCRINKKWRALEGSDFGARRWSRYPQLRNARPINRIVENSLLGLMQINVPMPGDALRCDTGNRPSARYKLLITGSKTRGSHAAGNHGRRHAAM